MPPKVIALVCQKGGSGKTTTAINLAATAQEAGKTVVVVDLDGQQASATEWFRTRDAANKKFLVQPTHPAALPDLIAAASTADWIIADTAGQTDPGAAAAVEVADLVLVPCATSALDLRAIKNTLRLCRIRDVKPHVVLTQIEPQGSIEQLVRDQLTKLDVAVLPGGLGRRSAFRHSPLDGRTASELEPKGKCVDELRALYREVCSLLGEKPASRLPKQVTGAKKKAVAKPVRAI